MNSRSYLIPVASLALATTSFAQTESKPSIPSTPKPEIDNPVAKDDRLRGPGFVFVEFDCYDIAGTIDFFRDVAGFQVNRNEGKFAVLRTKQAEILLNQRSPAPKPATGTAGDQPLPKYQGPRVEIGIVVEDLDKAFAAAQKHPDWAIAARIAHQSWGVRDFRVYSPERYYFRFTEAPH
jgi:hypothetical protein